MLLLLVLVAKELYEEPRQSGPTASEVAEACKNDLQCSAKKHLAEANVRCKYLVESLATYDFEWTDAWLESKFGQFRWTDSATRPGVITYFGEKIKFQNSFGAWIHHRYECDFDTLLKKPVDARAVAR